LPSSSPAPAALFAAGSPGSGRSPSAKVGDGNIHFNLTQPQGMDKAGYPARWQEFNDIVHGVVRELRGSISAE